MRDRGYRREKSEVKRGLNLSISMSRASCIVYLLVFLICTSPQYISASSFDGLKKTYSDITTMEVSFHQKIYIAGLKRERQFDGTFIYKRQKGFVWRYRTPKVKYFLYDGIYMWQAEEDKPFVIKEKVNREKTGGTFLDLVEDITRIDEFFTLKQMDRKGTLEVMELIPKKDSTVTFARVWFDAQNIITRIEINEFTGNRNIIEFTSHRINKPVDEAKFSTQPFSGKEIVER